MRTALTDLVGIEFPIFAFIHCRDVVAAVTNAGGMGVLGAVAHTPEALDVDLAWIREQTKGRPFGVDLLLPRKYVGAEQGGIDAEGLRALVPEEHREWIDTLLARYDVPALPEGGGDNAGRQIRVDPFIKPTSGVVPTILPFGNTVPFERATC